MANGGYQLIGLAIAAAIAFFVYTDAKKRGMNAILWAIGTLLLCIVFLPLYLIMRKPVGYVRPLPGTPPPLPLPPTYATPPQGYQQPPQYTPPPPQPSFQPPPPSPQTPPAGTPAASTQMGKFCPNCGAPHEATVKFCPNCGASL